MGHFARSLVVSLIVLVGIVWMATAYGGFFYSLWPAVTVMAITLWAVIGYISPMLSRGHFTDSRGLHLRMGLVFRADIPWNEVLGVEPYKGYVGSLGASFAFGEPRVSLATSRVGMVEVRIKPRRFPYVLWKKADRIVLSVSEPERLMSDIRRRLGQ